MLDAKEYIFIINWSNIFCTANIMTKETTGKII